MVDDTIIGDVIIKLVKLNVLIPQQHKFKLH